MVEHNSGSSPPKRIENHVKLLRRNDEPKVKTTRRRLEAMEREALHPEQE